MNKKEELLQSLIKSTQEGEIIWNISNNNYENIILNPDLVIRIFYTNYKEYIVLLIESKDIRYDEEFDKYYNSLYIYLDILDENSKLIIEIIPEEVSDSIYSELYHSIIKQVESEEIEKILS